MTSWSLQLLQPPALPSGVRQRHPRRCLVNSDLSPKNRSRLKARETGVLPNNVVSPLSQHHGFYDSTNRGHKTARLKAARRQHQRGKAHWIGVPSPEMIAGDPRLLGGGAPVAMVKTAQHWNRDELALARGGRRHRRLAVVLPRNSVWPGTWHDVFHDSTDRGHRTALLRAARRHHKRRGGALDRHSAANDDGRRSSPAKRRCASNDDAGRPPPELR